MALRWIQINQSWGSLFWEIVGITCFRLLVVTVDVDMGNTLKKSFSYFHINFIFSQDNESQKSCYKSCLFTIFCYVWWLLSTWCKSHFVLVIILRRSEPAVDPFLFSYNLNSALWDLTPLFKLNLASKPNFFIWTVHLDFFTVPAWKWKVRTAKTHCAV